MTRFNSSWCYLFLTYEKKVKIFELLPNMHGVLLGQIKSGHNNEVTVKAGFHCIHKTKNMGKPQKLIYKESKIKT